MKMHSLSSLLLCLLCVKGMCGEMPLINSFDKSGQLTWSYGYNDTTDTIARLEGSTDLTGEIWEATYYDFVSTNLFPPPSRQPIFFDVPTNSLRSVEAQMSQASGAFYRVAIQTNVSDPSLVLHLSFDNDFYRGIVLDSSGYGNNGLKYATNLWPSAAIGPDGSQAAEFHRWEDGSDFGVGEYIAVLGSPSVDYLSQATIAIWAHYYTAPESNYVYNHTATLLDASYGGTPGSWTLGRQFNALTSFLVFTDTNVAAEVHFPDLALTGDTGGWHYYVVTFDGTTITGYFDGRPVGSIPELGSMRQLRIGGPIADYIALATWAHNGTPQFGDDLYPNCCWMNGAMDDARIYNRALDEAEVLALYNSFDKQGPSVPTNIWARAAASSQIEIRWDVSTDSFYVAGYSVRRNGAVVGTASGPSYVDTGLASTTQHEYTIDAFDGAGNHSGQSAVVVANTLPAGSPVGAIVDNSDGGSRVDVVGNWELLTGPGSWGEGFRWGSESRGSRSVIYYPTLPGPGDYEVYLWYGGAPNHAPYYIYATNMPVDIVHSGVTNTVQVNQQSGYETWAYLGTYTFLAHTNEFVQIRTDGTAFHVSWGAVAADAVKFVK